MHTITCGSRGAFINTDYAKEDNLFDDARVTPEIRVSRAILRVLLPVDASAT